MCVATGKGVCAAAAAVAAPVVGIMALHPRRDLLGVRLTPR